MLLDWKGIIPVVDQFASLMTVSLFQMVSERSAFDAATANPTSNMACRKTDIVKPSLRYKQIWTDIKFGWHGFDQDGACPGTIGAIGVFSAAVAQPSFWLLSHPGNIAKGKPP